MIKRERRDPVATKNNAEVINLDSDDSSDDDHSFDFAESTRVGETQPGDDLPLDSIISGNIATRPASADPNEPSTSTSTQILAPKSAQKSRSVALIFNDSSSEDEAEKTIKHEPSWSPLSQSELKNESDDEDANEDPEDFSVTAQSQNLFETSLNTHFSDENYPTRYR